MTELEVDYAHYCQTCRSCLQVTTHNNGEVTYEHVDSVVSALERAQGHSESRPAYDHEPVPVPIREFLDAIVRCDFCAGGKGKYYYDLSKPVIEFDGTNTGTRWCCCEHCAPLIEARDETGLARRYMRTAPHRKDWTRGRRVEVYHFLIGRYGAILPAVLPGRSVLSEGDPFALRLDAWSQHARVP